jgi:hypothetical protein
LRLLPPHFLRGPRVCLSYPSFTLPVCLPMLYALIVLGEEASEVSTQGNRVYRSVMLVGAVALLFATQAAAFRTSTSIAMAMPAPVDTSQFVGLPSCPRLGLGLAALGRPG